MSENRHAAVCMNRGSGEFPATGSVLKCLPHFAVMGMAKAFAIIVGGDLRHRLLPDVKHAA